MLSISFKYTEYKYIRLLDSHKLGPLLQKYVEIIIIYVLLNEIHITAM